MAEDRLTKDSKEFSLGLAKEGNSHPTAENWTWQGVGMGSPSGEGTPTVHPVASLSSKRPVLTFNLLK